VDSMIYGKIFCNNRHLAQLISNIYPFSFPRFDLPAENTGEEVAMKTGVELLQRMREDAEFRQKVNACPNGAARLAFLQS